MSRTKRLVLALAACGVLLVVGAARTAPKLLLASHSTSYVMGWANDPPGGPHRVAFGTGRPEEMRGSPSNDLLA